MRSALLKIAAIAVLAFGGLTGCQIMGGGDSGEPVSACECGGECACGATDECKCGS